MEEVRLDEQIGSFNAEERMYKSQIEEDKSRADLMNI